MASKKSAKQKQLYTLASIENEAQSVGRVSSVRGGLLVDVDLADGSGILCEIPSRFSKTIWIKKGDFLIVEIYSETKTPSGQKESKVKAVVVHVLQADDIKQLKKDGDWPAEFELHVASKASRSSNPSGDLMANPNRRPNLDSDDDEDDDDSSDDLPPNPNRGMPPGSSDDEDDY